MWLLSQHQRGLTCEDDLAMVLRHTGSGDLREGRTLFLKPKERKREGERERNQKDPVTYISWLSPTPAKLMKDQDLCTG